MVNEPVVIPRLVAIVFIELFTCSIFYTIGLSLRALLYAHVWAAIYAALSARAAKKLEWQELIDEFPRWTYLVSGFNQSIVLPVIMLAVCALTPDITAYAEGAHSSSDVLSAHIYYNIIGNMIKDMWVTKYHHVTLITFGFLCHHLCTILGCAISLDLGSTFGYGVFNAVSAEVGSASYIFYMVRKNASSFFTYLVVMGLSNSVGLWISRIILYTENRPYYSTLYFALAVCIVGLRSIALLMKAYEEIVARLRKIEIWVFCEKYGLSNKRH